MHVDCSPVLKLERDAMVGSLEDIGPVDGRSNLHIHHYRRRSECRKVAAPLEVEPNQERDVYLDSCRTKDDCRFMVFVDALYCSILSVV